MHSQTEFKRTQILACAKSLYDVMTKEPAKGLKGIDVIVNLRSKICRGIVSCLVFNFMFVFNKFSSFKTILVTFNHAVLSCEQVSRDAIAIVALGIKRSKIMRKFLLLTSKILCVKIYYLHFFFLTILLTSFALTWATLWIFIARKPNFKLHRVSLTSRKDGETQT